MKIDLKQLNAQYKQWRADHPKLSGLIVVIESAAFGVLFDACTTGIDYSKNGLKHLGAAMGGAVAIAVRNYVKSNAADLKVKLQAQVKTSDADSNS